MAAERAGVAVRLKGKGKGPAATASATATASGKAGARGGVSLSRTGSLSSFSTPMRVLEESPARRQLVVVGALDGADAAGAEAMDVAAAPQPLQDVGRAPLPPTGPPASTAVRKSSRQRKRTLKAKEALGRDIPHFFTVESPRTQRANTAKAAARKRQEALDAAAAAAEAAAASAAVAAAPVQLGVAALPAAAQLGSQGLVFKAPRVVPAPKQPQRRTKQPAATAKPAARKQGPKQPRKKTPGRSKRKAAVLSAGAAAAAGAPTQPDIRAHFRTKSRRLTGREAQAAELAQIHEQLRQCSEPNLKEIQIEGKGLGVVSTIALARGAYVCEYSGELISSAEAVEREKFYALEDARLGNMEPMCYMYFLRHGDKTYCVDATKTGRIGRLINHSRKKSNLSTKLFVVDGTPRLGFLAKKDIPAGVELLYDYGDRDRSAIAAHPWLAQ